MLSLDVASIICFAVASGMVIVLHVVEKPAYGLLTTAGPRALDSLDNQQVVMATRAMLGRFLAAKVPQLKAGLLVAGTVCTAASVLWSGDYLSGRGLLVLYGLVSIPVIAVAALPAAQRLAVLPSSATPAETGAALLRLLKANRIGTLATLSFLGFSILATHSLWR